ncbi:MAG: DUF4399 domain-containing protein [Candidatus Thiodiazotropha sp.]
MSIINLRLWAVVLLTLGWVSPMLAATPAPEGAMLYIISPHDGDVVSNPVNVKFGLRGMGVAPAGIDKPNTGHHHLLIDVTEMPDMTKPLPSNDHHRHFGGGQTEVDLELSPGTHKLQLIMGDKNHIPFAPPLMSESINITVE